MAIDMQLLHWCGRDYLEVVVRAAGFEPAILSGASFQSWCVFQFRHARIMEPESMKMPPAFLFGGCGVVAL
jgi:hypothetical protein